MEKDLQYFLDAEKEFKERNPDYGQSFYDKTIEEFRKKGDDDRMNFLSNGVISQYSEDVKKSIGNSERYNLTDAQKLMIYLFQGRHSMLFRDDYYREVNEFIQNMMDTLESVIVKTPLNNDTTLYRYCTTYDRVDFKEGEVVTFPYSLTCTNKEWHKDGNVYVIKPLHDGNTRAHNLFEIYNHGQENQVNFLRNTSFRVMQVKNVEGTEYCRFYLNEI